MRQLFLFIAIFLLGTATVVAEPSNFRVGVGAIKLDSQWGGELFAEYPQNNHTASRFSLYYANDDYRIKGVEAQLFWGIGLAEPGFRLYTGPSWHYEKTKKSDHAWALQLGTGWQYRAITLDYSVSARDRHADVLVQRILFSYRF